MMLLNILAHTLLMLIMMIENQQNAKNEFAKNFKGTINLDEDSNILNML